MSIRRLVAWALLLVLVFWIASAQGRYIGNFLMGPYLLGAPELDQIRDVARAPHYFVRVVATSVEDTGTREISARAHWGKGTEREASGNYTALTLGSRLLVCKDCPPGGGVVEGELTPLPFAYQEMLASDSATEPVPRHYPFYLDDNGFRLHGYLATGALAVLLFLFVITGVPAYWYLRRPKSHPLLKRIAGWDEHAHVEALVQAAGLGGLLGVHGGWLITDNIVIRPAFFAFNVHRFTDLLWAYKKVTKHSINFIPVGSTWQVLLIFRHGTATLRRDQATDQILQYAAARAPWAYYGFDQLLKSQFDWHEDKFFAAVERRKQQWLARSERTKTAPSSPSNKGDVLVRAQLSLANAMTGGKHEVTVAGRIDCARCLGTGTGVGKPCTECGGAGSLERQRRVLVAYPAGVDDGQRLSVPGLGLPGITAAQPGDLYVEVALTPHPRFARRGDELRTHVKVAPSVARGAKVELELPDGSVTVLNIPASVLDGAAITVPGMGMPRLDRSGRGDLQVVVELAGNGPH